MRQLAAIVFTEMRISVELKAWATGMKGDWTNALTLFEEVHRLTNHPLKGLMDVVYASVIPGMNGRALECIQKIERRHPKIRKQS